jgi:hypothetical protein
MASMKKAEKSDHVGGDVELEMQVLGTILYTLLVALLQAMICLISTNI